MYFKTTCKVSLYVRSERDKKGSSPLCFFYRYIEFRNMSEFKRNYILSIAIQYVRE
jgi:hypothetical protein